jgi:hypothetical protein
MKQSTAARTLAENAGLASAGARVPPRLIVGGVEARRMLAARNRHGKPNADVLRPYRDAQDLHGGAPERWVVDFPADTAPEQASLYAEPWRRFVRAGGVLHARADPMRIAIARIDSYLAAPLGRVARGFARIDSATLPGAGLCVVASDDDFVAAVLQSGVFFAWVAAHGGRLRVWHIASFPFPWPPRTELGALTRGQLELRDAVIRANAAELDDAVTAAYGWRDVGDEADLVARLCGIHSVRE